MKKRKFDLKQETELDYNPGNEQGEPIISDAELENRKKAFEISR